MRLLHAVKKLLYFEPTNVITLKTQPHAVNTPWKRVSQRSFKDLFPKNNCLIVSSCLRHQKMSINTTSVLLWDIKTNAIVGNLTSIEVTHPQQI